MRRGTAAGGMNVQRLVRWLPAVVLAVAVLSGCNADNATTEEVVSISEGCGHNEDDYLGPTAPTPEAALAAHRDAIEADVLRGSTEFDRRLAEEHVRAIDEADRYETQNGASQPIWTITRDGREVARFVAASQPGGGWAVIDYSFILSGETCALIGS